MLKLKIKINWFWMSLLYFTFKAIAEMTPLNVRYKIRSVICSCSYFQRTAFTEIQSLHTKILRVSKDRNKCSCPRFDIQPQHTVKDIFVFVSRFMKRKWDGNTDMIRSWII